MHVRSSGFLVVHLSEALRMSYESQMADKKCSVFWEKPDFSPKVKTFQF